MTTHGPKAPAPPVERPAEPPLPRRVGDRLRVLCVDSRPRWEWRYLKGALLRDRRLAVQTVLLDADPGFVHDHSDGLAPLSVLPSPARLRDYDVIVLGDLAGHEDRLYPDAFVAIGAAVDAGAGLVVIDGEGSGRAWERTALGPLLPVRFDQGKVPERPFQLTRTRAGEAHPALRLADDPAADLQVWASLPDLYWQAAARAATSDAEVLAVDPETARPLLALRRQGQGQVAWLGVDETWRWRAEVGDRFMGRLHGQLIRCVAAGRAEERPRPRLWLRDGSERQTDLALFRGAGQFLTTTRGNVPLGEVERISVAASDACPNGIALALHDGSVLWGEPLGGGEAQVRLRVVPWGDVSVGLGRVRRIATGVAALAAPPAEAGASEDRVTLATGGTIGGVLHVNPDGQTFGVDAAAGRVDLPWSAMLNVDLALVDPAGPPADSPHVRVRLSTGVVLRATLVDLDGDIVRVRHPFLGALAAPRHLVLDLTFER